MIQANIHVLEPYLLNIDLRDKTADRDIQCALSADERYRNEDFAHIIDSTLEILANCQLVGCHNTRVLDVAAIRTSGIQLLNVDGYLSRMKATFDQLRISKAAANSAINRIELFLHRPCRASRIGKISFYAPFSLCETYSKFLLNIGGEVCAFTLRSDVPDVYTKLTANGTPVAICFRFNFSDIVSRHQALVATEMIRFLGADIIMGHQFSIRFDSDIIKEIDSSDILEVIENPPAMILDC
jgi:hypothetical protein